MLIAELGINHQGDMKKAKTMVLKAKQAGADAAKFQWYDAAKILGKESPYFAEANKAQFTWEQHIELSKYCKDIGIEWIVSAFQLGQIPFLINAGMKTIKIASRTALDDEMLKQAAKANVPIILSTGLCNKERLEKISQILKDSPRTFLYCICDYPTDRKKINFKNMMSLLNYAPTIGFSSHCPDINVSLSAHERGASVIEHHVVLDKAQKGCDVSSSITFNELSDLSKKISFYDSITLVNVYNDEQIEWLRQQRNRPELYRYFRQDAPISKEHQAQWWKEHKNSVRCFIIETSDARVGYIAFNPFDLRSKTAELGIFIIPEYEHKGYGSIAVKKLLNFGFSICNLSNVYSDCLMYPGEDRFAFYKKQGFVAFPKEHQTIRYKKLGQMIPALKFFMTKDMWEEYGKNGNGRLAVIGEESANNAKKVEA